MSDDKKKVTYEAEVGLDVVQSYLKELQAALKAGAVWVQSGNGIVGLTPADSVSLSVEAKRKKDRQSLTFELEWEPAAKEGALGEEVLIISSDEPEPVIVEEHD